MCIVAGCDRPLFAAGFCGPHYKRKWRYGDPEAGAPFRNVDPLTRMRDLWQEDESGCWLWTGCVDRIGYGTVWWNGTQRAHRAVYLLSGRTIPEGTELDHLCNRRHCVNPDHLEPVTHSENVRRGYQRRVR
jgi:hypothetical protein